MKSAQDYERRSRQHHGQFKAQDQTGSVAATLLQHDAPAAPEPPGPAALETYLSVTGQVSIASKKL
jgi:hypothetical protein